MEKYLLDKYGGRKINKILLKNLIDDIKNYEDAPTDDIIIDVSLDKILEAIKTFKNRDGDDLSPISKKGYISKIKSIYDVIPNFFQLLIDNPNNKEVINSAFKIIDDKYKNAKDYYAVISKVINNYEGLKPKISDYILGRLQQKIKESVNESVKSTDLKVDTEELKLTWNEFTDGVKELDNKSNVPLQDKVLFNLYKLLTLRDDFGNVKLVDEDLDNKTNFYNINTKTFHLNDFKTIKKFGRREYVIPDRIADMIQSLYDGGNKYLYESSLKKPYSAGLSDAMINVLSKKYFDKKFSINDIRKLVLVSYKSKTMEKQRNTAKIMLHSLSTAKVVYDRKKI